MFSRHEMPLQVDYDANLIAVANGVATDERAKAILKRVDSGRCSAAQGAGPQFVSEKYYGKHDTTHGNVGDSWCAHRPEGAR